MMYSGSVNSEKCPAQSDVTWNALVTSGGESQWTGNPAKRQKTDACARGTQRRSVNFHSIADLISKDDRKSPDPRDSRSPIKVIPSPLATLDMPGLLSLPLSVVTSAPGITSTMSTDLVITATPTCHKEVPARPSSTGTCSSANTSLSGSVENSPNSDDANESITPVRRSQNNKKGRTIYKAQQVVVLEQVFAMSHYPDADFVERLARDLSISEGKIKVWFQNKRARWRRRQGRGAEDSGSTTPTTAQPYAMTHPSGLMAADSQPVSDLMLGMYPHPMLHNLQAPETYQPAYMSPTAQLNAHLPQTLTSYPLPGPYISSFPRPELYMPPSGHFVQHSLGSSPLGHMTSYHLPSHFNSGTLLAK